MSATPRTSSTVPEVAHLRRRLTALTSWLARQERGGASHVEIAAVRMQLSSGISPVRRTENADGAEMREAVSPVTGDCPVCSVTAAGGAAEGVPVRDLSLPRGSAGMALDALAVDQPPMSEPS